MSWIYFPGMGGVEKEPDQCELTGAEAGRWLGFYQPQVLGFAGVRIYRSRAGAAATSAKDSDSLCCETCLTVVRPGTHNTSEVRLCAVLFLCDLHTRDEQLP